MAPIPDTDAITKLIGVLLSGFGAVRLFEPWRKKRMARATAEEMKVLARAEIDVEKIRLEGRRELRELKVALLPVATDVLDAEVLPESESTPLLLERVHERLDYQEAKRQLNVEQVALEAANELRGQQAAPEPVDEDWTARFFGSVQDVSSEQMQQLWGKILAGEVKRPGSFSLRCLETVKNLSKEEATLFERIAPYVVSGKFILRDTGDFEKATHLNLERALRLAEAGLLTADAQLNITLAVGQTKNSLLLSDLVIMLSSETERKHQFATYVLSEVGVELMKLFPCRADRAYARAFVARLRGLTWKVETFEGVRNMEGLTIVSRSDLFPPEAAPPEAPIVLPTPVT